jgi:uncharacterized protein (DUF433 family)
MPTNRYVEYRGGGYYIAGTRISLDSIAYAVQRGESVEDILADFPALESRQELEGVVAFIQAHTHEINAHLAENAQRWEDARKLNPPDLVEKARKYRKERDLKSA